VRVTADTELHFYLVWVTLSRTQWLHAPFHPWKGKWRDFDNSRDVSCMELVVPSAGTFPDLPPSAPCLESIVLLARREPLAPKLREELATQFREVVEQVRAVPARFGPKFLHDFVFPRDGVGDISMNGVRNFPDVNKVMPIEDPVYRLNSELAQKLGHRFDLIRTLTTANLGAHDADG
jgi:hypothetical protein